MRFQKFRTTGARRKERVRVIVKTLLGVFLFLALCSGIFFGMRHHAIRVQTIRIVSDGALDPVLLEAEAKRVIAGTYAWLIPKDIGIIVNTETIEKRLQEAFPRINEVRMVRNGFREITGEVRERTPRALWCGDIVPPSGIQGNQVESEERTDMQGECFMVDGGGYVYDRAPTYSDNAFVRFYASLDRAEPTGQYIVDSHIFANLLSFLHRLDDSGYVVQSVLFVDERDVELYLTDGMRILIQNPIDTEILYANLVALLSSDAIDRSRTVTYVDMRFGTRVYVKYEDGVEEDVSVR